MLIDQRVFWVGASEPSTNEMAELNSLILQVYNSKGAKTSQLLEEYVNANPMSGWTPSLKNILAATYLEHGQFTHSLDLWESVWAQTKNYKNNQEGKFIADYCLANWTRLLASLGRYDTLTALVKETDGRVLDRGPLTQKFIRTKEALADMALHPEVSYRCGTLAMINVCHELYGTNFDYPELYKIGSPTNGFTLKELAAISDRLNLGLIPVRLAPSAHLVVPSVVNWKQHHYGAILELKNGLYTVADPTMGRISHLTEAEIKAEASGYYMIPRKSADINSTLASKDEALLVYGKGNPYLMADGNDQPCPTCPTPAGSGPDNSGPKGNPSNPGKGGTCPSCGPVMTGGSGGGAAPTGMPEWGVSEPYINLWLQDQPLAYQPAFGPPIAFKLYFRDRAEYGGGYGYSDTALGLSWTSEWFQHFSPSSLSLLLPGGGNSPFADLSDRNYYNNMQLAATQTNADSQLCEVEIMRPDGSKNIYNMLTNASGYSTYNLYLTEQKDIQGNSVHFYYTNFFSYNPYSPPSLATVVDATGLTNTLSYMEDAYGFAYVTNVSDPFGRSVTIQYDFYPGGGSLYVITNITDPAGLSSSIVYDQNGWPTNLVTPYGTNVFTKLDVTTSEQIVRSVLVQDPMGGQSLYYFNQDTTWLTYPSAAIPTNTPYDTLDIYETYFRNSFVWGPRQFALLPSGFRSSFDFTTLTTNDFVRAKIRHWLTTYLYSGIHDIYSVDTLSMEQEPSPDGTTFGASTWYDYPGKPYPNQAGTQILPAVTARVMPDGSTSYLWEQRDDWGHVTNSVSEWFENGQVQLRTNSYQYSANGFDLMRVVAPDGITNAAYGYDASHHVLVYTNALGEVTQFTYNGNGQLTGTVAPNGLVTTNIYGTDGFVSQHIVLGYSTNSFTFSKALLLTQTDARGLKVTNTWDNLSRLTSTSFPDGTYNSNRYFRLDLAGVRDRNGNWTSYGYDGNRRKVKETNALNNVMTYTFCTCGALDSVQDFGGNATYFFYDDSGRLTNTLYPDGLSLFQSLDQLNRLVYIRDSSGSATTNMFNNHGLIMTNSSAAGILASYIYNIDDLVTNQVDVNGVKIYTTYDKLRRIRTKKYPDGGIEAFGYSANVDDITSFTNQLNNVWTYAYDLNLRRTNEVAVGIYTNAFVYSGAGDLLSLIDAKAQTTSWAYDQFGRVTNKFDTLGTLLFTYQYDANGRLTNRSSAAKGATAYSYDAVGNLTLVDYPTSPDITMKYDSMNRLTNMVDAVGTTRYSYDVAGQLLAEDGPWDSDTVTFTYQNRMRTGLSVGAISASPWTQTYAYDQARRLTNITSQAGSFTYVLGGSSLASPLVKRLLLPNGANITNNYDGSARLLSTHLRNSSGGALDTEDYVYNAGGQRTQEVFTAGNSMGFTYDSIGQLKTAFGKESGGSTNRMQEQFGYSYDASGNLTFRTNNTLLESFSVNGLNELGNVSSSGTLTVAGSTSGPATNVTVNTSNAILYADATFASTNQPLASNTNVFVAVAYDSYGRVDTNAVTARLAFSDNMTYDPNGNLLLDKFPAGGTNRVFAYDDENQLTAVWVTNTWKSEFAYDGKRRCRIRKEFSWNGGSWLQIGEVHYVYDGINVIQERDADSLAQVTYTRGDDSSGSFQGAGGIGGLLARTDMVKLRSGSPLADAFYHADGSGNITSLIDRNQNVAARYKYDAFGNTISKSGFLAELNVYQFSSKEYHSASGLIRYLYRYYDPNLQRWINRDPIGERGGINCFEFVNNNVPNAVDPFGLRYSYWPPPININSPPQQAKPAPSAPYTGPGLYKPPYDPWPPYNSQHHMVPPICCTGPEALKCLGALSAAAAQGYAVAKACNPKSPSYDPINCNIQYAKLTAAAAAAASLCQNCLAGAVTPAIPGDLNYNPYQFIPL